LSNILEIDLTCQLMCIFVLSKQETPLHLKVVEKNPMILVFRKPIMVCVSLNKMYNMKTINIVFFLSLYFKALKYIVKASEKGRDS
jgi:hypothetical protein